MKRSPLKSTSELKRKTPLQSRSTLRSTPGTKKQPAAQPKVRTRKCAIKTCRKLFTPRSMTHRTCGPECAEELVQVEKARKARKERQAGLAALKTRTDFLKEAQRAFNAFIRERDAHLPCVCCGRFPKAEHMTGGTWDAGHYRSVGSAPHLRFHEDNCHRQLKQCNQWGAGRAVDYRIGLIARIGQARVEALEADNTVRKFTTEELQQIIATYKKKLRDLRHEKALLYENSV